MRYFIIIFFICTLVSCKKSKKSEPEPVIPAPAKAVLVSPAKDAACNQGNIVSATESTVTLKWASSANTNSYEVFIKNLLTSVTTSKTVTTTELTQNFLQNTPYSWYVISKASATTVTAQSETWKFYNSGTSNSSFAPYPAELTSPAKAAAITVSSGKATLSWNGADADNDIVGYDVYMGTSTSNMTIIKSNITSTTINDATVISGNTYYWKVVTKDAKNNSSTSETYNFKVN